MDRDNEAISFATGVGGAIALGIALIPLRGFTPAANFTFVFMALTVAMAEWGGRRSAVATALASALSLDFFLTEPYMKLTIAAKDDVIAFAGLAACGLVAAAFGSDRGRRGMAVRHRAIVHHALRHVEEAGPVAGTIAETLDAARTALPIAAFLVRDASGSTVAASPGAAARPKPTVALRSDALPVEGGSLPLVAARREVGSLDIWGTGEAPTVEEQRTLADVASVIAVRLALAQESRSL